jgi:hypothetical protein
MSASGPSLRAILAELGYGEPREIGGRTSIVDLFSRSGRCGVYVLEFENGEVYGGKTGNVVRRYAEHLRRHADVRRLFFKRVAKGDLRAFEEQVIHRLENGGLAMRNITFASRVIGVREFDSLMPPDLQVRFEDDTSFNDASGIRLQDTELRCRRQEQDAAFVERPESDTVLEVLRPYVRRCIPAFVRSEYTYWTLTAPPGEPRTYCRVNVGWQEVLRVYEDEDEECWFSFHVARSMLGLAEAAADAWDGQSRFRTAQISDHAYKPGGSDQVRIIIAAEEALALLEDQAFLRAARRMNLCLMRKGSTPSYNFHCFALADRVLGAP